MVSRSRYEGLICKNKVFLFTVTLENPNSDAAGGIKHGYEMVRSSLEMKYDVTVVFRLNEIGALFFTTEDVFTAVCLNSRAAGLLPPSDLSPAGTPRLAPQETSEKTPKVAPSQKALAASHIAPAVSLKNLKNKSAA
jgi:hypothetical protein